MPLRRLVAVTKYYKIYENKGRNGVSIVSVSESLHSQILLLYSLERNPASSIKKYALIAFENGKKSKLYDTRCNTIETFAGRYSIEKRINK
jgi:hypothetical protein